MFEQCFNERIKLLTMLSQKLLGFSVAVTNDFPDFIVDSLRRFVAKVQLAPRENHYLNNGIRYGGSGSFNPSRSLIPQRVTMRRASSVACS